MKNIKGGFTKTLTIKYKNKDFKVEIVDDNDGEVFIKFLENPNYCGLIHVQKGDYAYISEFSPIETCSNPNLKLPGEGYIMMEVILKLLTDLKDTFKIKYIDLTDLSYKFCDLNETKISLPMLYTLTHGVPWYYKFKFRSFNKLDIASNNYKIMNKITNNDFNIKSVIDNYLNNSDNNIDDKNILIKEYNWILSHFKNQKQLLMTSFYNLSKVRCDIISILIKDIFKTLKLKSLDKDVLRIKL